MLLIPFAPDVVVLPALPGVGTEFPHRSQFSAKVSLSATTSELIAVFEVKDSTPFPSRDPKKLYEGDAVELAISGPGTQGIVQAILDTGTDAGRQQVLDYRENKALAASLPASAKGAVTRLPGGYRATLSIPWNVVSAEPKPGAVFGVRVSAMDAASGRGKWTVAYRGDSGSRDFFDLPQAGIGSPSYGGQTSAWGGFSSDLRSVHAGVLAPPEKAGSKAAIAYGAQKRTVTLKLEDGMATGRARFSAGAPGSKSEGFTASLEGAAVPLAPLPDLAEERRTLFLRSNPLMAPVQRVVRGAGIPELKLARKALLEGAVGKISLVATFYNSDGKPVSEFDKPGRYGAIVKARADGGLERTEYVSFYRPRGKTSESDPMKAAAAESTPPDDYPVRADRHFWHKVRTALGAQVTYRSYVKTPAAYDRELGKKWPLVVFLHGSGSSDPKEATENWMRFRNVDGPMGRAHSDPNCPFVAASLLSFGGWFPPAVHDAIDRIAAEYRIDEDRIILCGFSMGAMGTWEAAYDRPERFAGIVPVGGRTGNPQRMFSIKGVPAWVFNGGADPVTTAEDARIAVKTLKDSGGDVRYTEIAGAGHGESNQAWSMPELYEWMMTLRRGR